MFMFLFFEHNKKTNKIYITGPYIKQTSKLGFQNKENNSALLHGAKSGFHFRKNGD